MKRLVTLFILAVCFFPIAGAQNTNTMPNTEELQEINDSILAEAYQLYLHEKIAWILEDEFFGSDSKAKSNFGGWVPITEDGITVKGVFYNKEKTKAVYEATFNLQTGETSSKDSVRDLTADEKDEIKIRETITNAVRTLDNLPECPEGCTFNVETTRIDEDLYRVYFMLGTSQRGIIPFGCDFSYDCDSKGNVKEFRRYHNSYIPAPLTMDGKPVRELIHSHTSICPYIAPTDIALFLLYGYESTGLKGFKVYSSALKCYFVFDAENYEIKVESR